MRRMFSVAIRVFVKDFYFERSISKLKHFSVCANDEILVGDSCIYSSKSTGDIQTKQECEAYKNSYNVHPFMLPDASMIYSKSAYLMQAKVCHLYLILK